VQNTPAAWAELVFNPEPGELCLKIAGEFHGVPIQTLTALISHSFIGAEFYYDTQTIQCPYAF
jgi:hypothetical protein